MNFLEHPSPSAAWQSSTSCLPAVPRPGLPTVPVGNHGSNSSWEGLPSADSPPSLIVDDGEETDSRTISTIDTPRYGPAKTIYHQHRDDEQTMYAFSSSRDGYGLTTSCTGIPRGPSTIPT
jgi:hypothetical protein